MYKLTLNAEPLLSPSQWTSPLSGPMTLGFEYNWKLEMLQVEQVHLRFCDRVLYERAAGIE
jgi:hypothetical protein